SESVVSSPSGNSSTAADGGGASTRFAAEGAANVGVPRVQVSARMPATIRPLNATRRRMLKGARRTKASPAAVDRQSIMSAANRAGTRTDENPGKIINHE